MSSALREIAPERIRRNPENPRLFFRQEEMDTLMSSIRRYGIQVPVTVYAEGAHFVLLDGERRWRCATKLNLSRIPALVKEKPTRLNNLLLMFNIHALREQWDYLTIARKLPDVIVLFRKENKGREPTEIELSELTGLTRGQIRRCRYLLDLPDDYRKILEEELSLPKQLQRLSEDFFIEMERALKTIQKRIPAFASNLNEIRDALIFKFRKEIIGNITDFRMLSKIATSISNLGVKETKAKLVLDDIFDRNNNVGIQEVFAEQFEMRYDERKILINVDSIVEYLVSSMEEESDLEISAELRDKLLRLQKLIGQISRA